MKEAYYRISCTIRRKTGYIYCRLEKHVTILSLIKLNHHFNASLSIRWLHGFGNFALKMDDFISKICVVNLVIKKDWNLL